MPKTITPDQVVAAVEGPRKMSSREDLAKKLGRTSRPHEGFRQARKAVASKGARRRGRHRALPCAAAGQGTPTA